MKKQVAKTRTWIWSVAGAFLLALCLWLIPASTLPVHAGRYCSECENPEVDEWCLLCELCSDCVEMCDRCEELCISCHASEAFDPVDEYVPCPECGRCKAGEPQYCSICGLCADCAYFCEGCTDDVCMDCHEGLDGGGEVILCPICDTCKQDGRGYCSECDYCGDCAEICIDCGLCLDCAESMNGHCEECGNCYEMVDMCADGGEHCEECCVIQGYVCEECGLCLEGAGEDGCITCGLCEACCREAVEAENCVCEDVCWQELDESHFCVDCGTCFGEVEQCATCLHEEEYRCEACCEYLSQIGVHNAKPSTAWTINETSHWHECKWCDEESHITGKAYHTYDEDGICKDCGFLETGGIVITSQPKNCHGVASYNGWSVDSKVETTTLSENTVTFSVKAYGKEGSKGLRYQWYELYKNTNRGVTVSNMLTDDEDEYRAGTRTPVLTVYVPSDVCVEGTSYFYYCVITDAEGNSVISEKAQLIGKHKYDIYQEGHGSWNDDGHVLYCRGYGCGEKKENMPHEYKPWAWVIEDGVQKKKFRTCMVCYYQQVGYVHEHDYDFGHLYEAEGGEVTEKKADDSKREYIYEFDYNGKTMELGANKVYHWIDCSKKNCTFTLKEEHDWSSWKIVNPATKDKAGTAYSVCQTCEMEKTWSKTNYEWHTHPINVKDGRADQDFAAEGTMVTVIPTPIEGKRVIGGVVSCEVTLIKGGINISDTMSFELEVVKSGLLYRFQVPSSVKNKNETIELGAAAMNVTFLYGECFHGAEKVINAKEAACLEDGYTGDTVCKYCEHLIQAGSYTFPTGHGDGVVVSESVYKTDRNGNIHRDKNNNPIYVLHAAETVYCDEDGRGSYTGDIVCENCGELLEKGSYKPYAHDHKLLNEYSQEQQTYWMDTYGCSLAQPPVGSEAGYSGDQICTKCGDILYGKPVYNEKIYKVEISILDYPKQNETVTVDDVKVPEQVVIRELTWYNPASGKQWPLGSAITEVFVPAKLELYLELEAKEGCWFVDYESTQAATPAVSVLVNDTPALDAHGYGASDAKYGRIAVNVKKPGIQDGTLRGTIKSTGSETDPIKIQLYKSGSKTPAYETSVKGTQAEYAIVGVVPGNYTLRVNKAGHDVHNGSVTIPSNLVNVNVTLNKTPVKTGKISGTITSGGDASANITVWLLLKGTPEAAYECVVKGNSAAYTIDNVTPGTYTLRVMKKDHNTYNAEVNIAAGTMTQNVSLSKKNMSNPFVDVKTSDFFYEAVLWAAENKVTTGTDATHFSPDATCTRGQVVTFLWRAAGCPEPASTSNPFVDVKTTDYFYEAVLWAVGEGITNGTSANTFSPDQGCTRSQVVTFLWRSQGAPAASGTNPFVDVPHAYYYDAVLWAVAEGITNGTDATHFSPDMTCTRGQIVTFLYRCLGD